MSKNLRFKQAKILERVSNLSARRLEYKRQIRIARKEGDTKKVFDLYQSLTSRLGRRASPVRYRRTCAVTGRSRGNYRFFNLCRMEILKA